MGLIAKKKGLFGIRGRVQERTAKRKEANQDRAGLGGSQAAQKQIYKDASDRTAEGRSKYDDASSAAQEALKRTQSREAAANVEYTSARGVMNSRADEASDAIGAINSAGTAAYGTLAKGAKTANSEYTQGAQQANDTRSNALATGSLTGTASSLLSQRAATIAAAPTIQQANETNIAANTTNAHANQAASTQMLNRQAQGLAAGQGEGGALAMQQALASAGTASGDAASAGNLALNDQNAQARYAAAMAQNAQTVDTANLGLSTGMDAASQERANQLGVAQANAASLEGAAGSRAGVATGLAGDQAGVQFQTATTAQAAKAAAAQQAASNAELASGRQVTLGGQVASQATNASGVAAAASDSDKQYQSTILTEGAAAQKAAADAKGRSLARRVFTPFGMLGN